MKKTARLLRYLSALAFFLPGFAFAQVQITEIMYDTPGADSGREWIEVTNIGIEPVDISTYRFFEADTNHKLVLASGSGTLLPGGSAIIADDGAKFLTDWSSFSGTLFTSAFSLSNTGESLAVKDGTLSTVDSVAYTALSDANGTGGSLQKQGETFVAALPTPGIYPGELKPVPKAVVPAKSAPVKKKEAGKTTAKTSDSPASFSAAPAAVATTSTIPPLALWSLGLVSVIALGIGGVLFVQSGRKETSSLADEFEIE